eukprot:2075266-Prymnesium_polylepis.1
MLVKEPTPLSEIVTLSPSCGGDGRRRRRVCDQGQREGCSRQEGCAWHRAPGTRARVRERRGRAVRVAWCAAWRVAWCAAWRAAWRA